jgi:hypothetical protein
VFGARNRRQRALVARTDTLDRMGIRHTTCGSKTCKGMPSCLCGCDACRLAIDRMFEKLDTRLEAQERLSHLKPHSGSPRGGTGVK